MCLLIYFGVNLQSDKMNINFLTIELLKTHRKTYIKKSNDVIYFQMVFFKIFKQLKSFLEKKSKRLVRFRILLLL